MSEKQDVAAARVADGCVARDVALGGVAYLCN